MTTAFFDRVKFYTATIGQGPVLAGAALSRYRGPVQAAIPDGAQCALLIEMSGGAWEVSTGVWNQAAGTFSRVLRESYPVPGALLNLDGTGVVTVTVGAQEMVEASAFVYRNRLINGSFQVDQRHAGAFVTFPLNGNLVPIDRWRCGAPGSGGVLTVQQNVMTIGYVPVTYSPFGVNVYCSGVLAVLAAGDSVNIGQAIEGVNIADLKWGTAQALPVTVSFVIAAGVAGDYGVSLSNGANNLSYVHKVTLAQFAITRVTFTVPGPTTGAWTTDNSAGLWLRICGAAGTTLKTATLDVWQAGLFLAPSTQVNMMSAVNQNMVITDVQLEVGSLATPFERRPFAVELQLCQRYYENNMPSGAAPADGVAVDAMPGVTPATNTPAAGVSFKVEKRAPPAMTLYCLAGRSAPGQWTAYTNAANIDWTATTVGRVSTKGIQVSGTMAMPNGGSFLAFGGWAADAEI